MIKINLLGKKKKPAPFGLDKLLEKAGVSSGQIEELKPAIPRILFIAAAIYISYFIPNYFLEQKIAELQGQQAVVSEKLTKLRAELGSMKKTRDAMDKLTKEEAEIDAQLATIEGLSRGRSTAFTALNGILELLPNKVWIDRITYSDGSFSINGSSWEYFSINDFVRSLSESTKYEAVTLKNIRADAPSGTLEPGVPAAEQKTKSFQIEMLVQGANKGDVP
jgi:Tfp pilus assembly protein PilN